MDPNPEEPNVTPVVEEPNVTPVVEEPNVTPVVEEPTIFNASVPAPVVETIPPNTQVLDAPIEKTFTLLGFRVSVINLQLGAFARLAIHLNCKRGEEHYIEYKELLVEGDDYAAWGADDKYIMEFVYSKLSTLF